MPDLKLPELSYRWGGFLASYPARLKWWCKNGFTNDSKWTEIIVRDVMNAFFGWDLECGEKCNDAGWDLCDKEAKVLVQVTNNCTHEKVENCLRGTCKRIDKEPQYRKFTLYIVFASIEEDAIDQLRKRAAKKMDKSAKDRKRGEELYDFSLEHIEFDPEKHIFSFDSFIQPVLADRISKDQKEQFIRVLDNFDSPFYLPREVCKLDPEERYHYYLNVDTICLDDVYNLLTDPTNTWAQELRTRFGKPDLELPPECGKVVSFGFDSYDDFLREILPERTITNLFNANATDHKIVRQIMDGSYRDNIRERIEMLYRQQSNRELRDLMDRCRSLYFARISPTALKIRIVFIRKLLDTLGSASSLICNCLIGNESDQWRAFAALVFFAFVGENCFGAVVTKEKLQSLIT